MAFCRLSSCRLAPRNLPACQRALGSLAVLPCLQPIRLPLISFRQDCGRPWDDCCRLQHTPTAVRWPAALQAWLLPCFCLCRCSSMPPTGSQSCCHSCQTQGHWTLARLTLWRHLLPAGQMHCTGPQERSHGFQSLMRMLGTLLCPRGTQCGTPLQLVSMLSAAQYLVRPCCSVMASRPQTSSAIQVCCSRPACLTIAM